MKRSYISKRSSCLSTLLVGVFSILMFAAGCGDDSGAVSETSSARLSDAEPAPSSAPLTLEVAKMGVPIYWEELELIQGNERMTDVTTKFGAAVVVSQVFDERDLLKNPPSSFPSCNEARDCPQFYQPKKRLGDLFEEVDDALAASGSTDWSQYVVVFDLFRNSGEWLVRWDGVKAREYIGEGAYGLWRDDMRSEVSAAILEGIAESVDSGHPITHIVIGQDMERLLLLNPEDFANFVSFYKELKASVKADYPEMKVSAGLNWDRLMSDVAAFYSSDGTVDDVKWSDRRAVWRDIAKPLYEDADFIALSTEPEPDRFGGKPDGLPETHYALLPELQGELGGKGVVWYSMNWPITSNTQKIDQRNFLRKFVEYNGDTVVDLAAWKSMFDYGPSECANLGSVEGDPSRCNAGLFSDSTAPTDLSDEFIELGE